MTPEALVLALRKIRVSDISDACDANGLFFQVMNQRMRPLQEGRFSVGEDEACMCGQAYTIRGLVNQYPAGAVDSWEDYHRAIDPPGALENYLKLLDRLKDRVVVTDLGGAPLGFWGSDNSMAAVNRGAIGIVIDGGVRDSYEVKKEGIKIWSTSRTCLHLWPRLNGVDENVPVMCAGVKVCPGDIICADDDGVVVVPLDKAEKVLEYARKTLEWDQNTRRKNYDDAGMAYDATLQTVK